MKQIGIRLEEELIKKAKQYALDTNISLQNLFSEALTSYLDNKLSPISPDSNDNKITSYQTNKLSSNTRVLIDEDGIPYTVTDDTPDWKKKEFTAQDFYGKVPEPYTPGPYDHDPRKYFEDDDDEPITPKKAIPAKDDDDDWRPF